MKNKSILILGAKSDIGLAIAYRFAKEGYDIQLAARNVTSLNDIQLDIELRYCINVTLYEFDALQIQKHNEFVDKLVVIPMIVVSTIGLMGNQLASESDIDASSLVIRSNFEGPASILGILANKFVMRNTGTLIGISSIAGERGRASNYIYGSAKAGFTAFLSGLRNRLHSSNVNVITVKAGFVETKMTRKFSLPAYLTGSPEELAEVIYIGMNKKNDIIFYKSIWLFITMILNSLPEFIFKRNKL